MVRLGESLYWVWENIELPKYFIKAHTGCEEAPLLEKPVFKRPKPSYNNLSPLLMNIALRWSARG